MSGGNYCYLYNADDWISHSRIENLRKMIEDISECYDSPNRRKAVKELKFYLNLLETASGMIEIVNQGIDRGLLKAVEWHQSCDTSKEDVEQYLNNIEKPEN